MTDRNEVLAVAGAMQRWGGSFVRALGELLLRADPMNVEKIKATWPDIWTKYASFAETEGVA